MLTYFSTSVDSTSALITPTAFLTGGCGYVRYARSAPLLLLMCQRKLGEVILVALPPTSYDPVDDAPIPLTENRSRRHGHSGSGSAAERQQLKFNTEDQFRDHDDDPHHYQHRPRDSKDGGKNETTNQGTYRLSICDTYLPMEILGNDEARTSLADVVRLSPAAATPSPPSSSSRTPVAPSMSRTNSHASGGAENSATAAASTLERVGRTIAV
ncbi:hypothetical protein FRC01_001735 [Tulasnella sp. 417]|nr:hypothetical protein FRC01_001735 [Tulasnella sp. 417]